MLVGTLGVYRVDMCTRCARVCMCVCVCVCVCVCNNIGVLYCIVWVFCCVVVFRVCIYRCVHTCVLYLCLLCSSSDSKLWIHTASYSQWLLNLYLSENPLTWILNAVHLNTLMSCKNLIWWFAWCHVLSINPTCSNKTSLLQLCELLIARACSEVQHPDRNMKEYQLECIVEPLI